jgi:hypothetical protein
MQLHQLINQLKITKRDIDSFDPDRHQQASQRLERIIEKLKEDNHIKEVCSDL